jgi:APA family basic amino acid/polyamine antiporter
MFFKDIFRKKSFAQLDAEAGSEVFVRKLGLTQLIILGLGAVIGGGVFVFTGKAAFLHAGPAVIISFALSGFICICAGLCYAEFASLIPVSGSSYTYVYATLGEFPAWLIGCSVIFAYFLAAASVGSGWSSYFVSILLDYGITLPAKLLYRSGTILENAEGSKQYAIIDLPAFFVSIISMAVLYVSTSSSAWLNATVVSIKMIVLGLFIYFGIGNIDPQNWHPFIPENIEFGRYGWSGIISGISIVFLGFIGFEAVCVAAQETKNPQRNVPIGVVASICISTLTYILVAVVLTGVVNYKLLDTAKPISLAVQSMNMPILSYLIKMGAISAITSVILVHQYTIVRLLYAISKDGLLPNFFNKMHKRFHTPHLSTLVVGIAMAIVSSTIQIEKILRLSSFFMLLGITVICGSIIYLRIKEPSKKRSFKCPFVPVVPLVSILCSLIILCSYKLEVFLHGITCLLLASVIYFLYGRHNSKIA